MSSNDHKTLAMHTDTAVLYVDTPSQLINLCRRLESSPWLAVDTEFLRESTYYPRFCLLQIAGKEILGCIDPIRLRDLEPLWQILYRPTVTKVLHAARQDLEILHHLHGRLPEPVFDTQLAAPLLGYPDQISYAQLVEEVLGVRLPKGHSRTDWSRRPLSPQQIAYAADDVRHLGPLYLKLRHRLEVSGRLGWLEEDFAALSAPATYTHPPREAWRRIKGAHRLKGRQLAVLQRLAAWREETAMVENLPRGWVLKDDLLCHIARLQPTDPKTLAQLRGISDKTLKRHGKTLCRLVAAGMECAPAPSPARPPKPSSGREAVIDLLSAVVRLQAEAHGIHSSVLASRRDLERFLDDPQRSRLCQGWRRALIGTDLLAFIGGKRRIRIAEGQLQVEAL